MAIWLVRAGKSGEDESFALDNNVVVVGWSELPDLSSIENREELANLLNETYPDSSSSKIGNFTGQLWSFIKRIQIGDIVALPLKTRSKVAFGKITGNYLYKPDNPSGAKHTRSVEWLQTDIARDLIGQDLLYSLGAFMTVCQIKRNNAEERINTLIEKGIDPELKGGGRPTASESDDETIGGGEAPLDIEEYTRNQISNYINANFKGHKMTELVGAILQAQGYETDLSLGGPDGGADVLAAGGPMGFDSPRICVQVKSGGVVDVVGLRELNGVIGTFGADNGLLVSWGGFSSAAVKEARAKFFKIRLWSAQELLTNLLECYDQLPEDFKAYFPLKQIWIFNRDV